MGQGGGMAGTRIETQRPVRRMLQLRNNVGLDLGSQPVEVMRRGEIMDII